jgi:hypothetical protein
MQGMKLVDISAVVNELEINVTRISGNCLGASMTLRRVTSLQLTVKDDKDDVVADFHGIFARWRSPFLLVLECARG